LLVTGNVLNMQFAGYPGMWPSPRPTVTDCAEESTGIEEDCAGWRFKKDRRNSRGRVRTHPQKSSWDWGIL